MLVNPDLYKCLLWGGGRSKHLPSCPASCDPSSFTPRVTVTGDQQGLCHARSFRNPGSEQRKVPSSPRSQVGSLFRQSGKRKEERERESRGRVYGPGLEPCRRPESRVARRVQSRRGPTSGWAPALSARAPLLLLLPEHMSLSRHVEQVCCRQTPGGCRVVRATRAQF